MKKQSILFVLLLLLFIFITCGCSSSNETIEDSANIPLETSDVTEESAAPLEAAETEEALLEPAPVEDAIGVFEGLEDNHTAIFSFDGAETAFYFEEDAVQNVLFEAVSGSNYTLSYHYDDSLGYVIYKISE